MVTDVCLLKNLKCLTICEISQISRHLGNSPSTHTLKAFPKFKRESEGGLFPNKYISQKTNNFPNVSGKFPKILGTWEISQMPEYLGNFPNAWVSGKFLECLGIWEISQMPGYLGNFPYIQSFEKFSIS